ncbi:MAG: SDR family oxidoreductase [Actinobacteria bacterium]|nr:SDR family oxidoreductase [Actinomycetota bacterium]
MVTELAGRGADGGDSITGGEPVAFVTGGAGPRIGAGLCRALAEEGWHVVVADLDGFAAEQVAQSLVAEGLSAEAEQLDTSSRDSIRESIGRVLDGRGRIDGLVNSAGVGQMTPADELTDSDYERVVGIDLRGPWWCAQAVLPEMKARGKGSIVSIGSVHSMATMANSSLYAAAKSGVAGLTRGIASDWGRFGIRCNVVHPGLVPSAPELREMEDSNPGNGWWLQHQLINAPIAGLDIGRAVAFLLSDRAACLTGAELVVDGGLTSMLTELSPLEPRPQDGGERT